MTTTELIIAIVAAILTLLGSAAASAQVWVAVSANRQAALAQRVADRQRLDDDKRFALAICEPLATREVHTILNSSNPSPEDISLLRALYELSDVRGASLLSDEVKNDRAVADTINATLDPVREFLAGRGEQLGASQLDSKLGQVDRTRFSWDGSGSHSKIWTINLIAQRWAGANALTAKAAFEESFGAELRKAVPGRADEFTAKWLLVETISQHVPELLLVLDGVPYGIHWRCGFRNSQIGSGVHRPVIEHFASAHAYPALPL